MSWNSLGMVFKVSEHQKTWMNSHAIMPVAIELESCIRVFFSTRSAQGISAVASCDLCPETLSLISLCDQPLIEKGEIGCFDDSGVLASWIMHQNNEIWLYYNGYNVRNTVPWSNAIGLAKSSNGGITFAKVSAGPILDRNVLDPFFVVSPCVLSGDGGFEMIYTSGSGWVLVDGKPEPRYILKLANSDDGVEWTRRNTEVHLEGLAKDESVARAVLNQESGQAVLYAITRDDIDFRDGNGAYRINRFTPLTSGLSHWVKENTFTGIPRTPEADDKMQCYPFVLKRESKPDLMFYNGNSFGQAGFLAAEYYD